MEDEEENEVDSSTSSRKRRLYPVYSLDDAVVIANALKAIGGRVDYQKNKALLASAMNLSVGGRFLARVASAKNWGLIEKKGDLILTELGKKILTPVSEDERVHSRAEAYLGVPIFLQIYRTYYATSLPNKELLGNILERNFGVAENDKEDVVNIVSAMFDDVKGEPPPGLNDDNVVKYLNSKQVSSFSVVQEPPKPKDTSTGKVSFLVGKLQAYSEVEPMNKVIIANTLDEIVGNSNSSPVGVISTKLKENLESLDSDTIKFVISLLSALINPHH